VRFCIEGLALEANPVVLDAGIRNSDEPNFLVASADVGDVDAQGFQTSFQLFDGEVLIVRHD
jgi:hypothetical protein